jgi:hypothetical protein
MNDTAPLALNGYRAGHERRSSATAKKTIEAANPRQQRKQGAGIEGSASRDWAGRDSANAEALKYENAEYQSRLSRLHPFHSFSF